MGVTILRPGNRVLTLGDLGTVTVRHGRAAAAGGNWWDNLSSVWAAYQPKGAASLAASYTDLSGNGNDAVVGVAPTWDSGNGWKFNGTTQYLEALFTTQLDQSQSVLIQFTTLTNTGALFGEDSAFDFVIQPNQAGANRVRYRNGGVAQIAPLLAAGNLAIAGNQGYRDGVADGGAIPLVGVVIRASVYIAAIRAVAAEHFCAVYIQAFALCDVAESAAAVLATATAMAAL